MNDFETPLFKKTYDLYKTFCGFRNTVSKKDLYTVWQRSENCLLELFELIMSAMQAHRPEKLAALESASVRLNMMRVFVRLMKDLKTIDAKKYLLLQANLDEIGRMIGGWIRSAKETPQQTRLK
mgnify:CR=1 FL=1